MQTARGNHNRLVLALLLVWARVERVIVSHLGTLPEAVIGHVSQQLGLAPTVVQGYGRRAATHTAPAGQVCRHLGCAPSPRGMSA